MDHTSPLMTSPAELGLLLSFPPLSQQIGATFDNNPTVLAILWYYCFITQNIDHFQLNLERHDIERTGLFGHLMESDAFQNDIRPLIEEYRQRIWRNEPYDQRPEPPRTPSDPRSEEPSLSDVPISPEDIPLPTSNESSNPSVPITVPIHNRASSSLNSFDENESLNESLDYHTAPTICGKCKWTGHTRSQCIWSREITCNRCEQQGHSERSCNADMYIDRARFGRQSPPWLVIIRLHEWKYEPDTSTMLATTH